MKLFTKKQVVLPPSIKQVEERRTLRIIRLQGELNVSREPEINKFVRDFRSRPEFEFKNMILDFKDVPYADSSAVARLVQTMFDYKKAHHDLAIVNLNDTLRNVLEVMKIDKLIRWYPSEEDAVKALSA